MNKSLAVRYKEIQDQLFAFVCFDCYLILINFFFIGQFSSPAARLENLNQIYNSLAYLPLELTLKILCSFKLF
jgi:hypothetical protein